MLSYSFYILLLCLLSVGWLLLAVAGYFLLRYRRRSPALLLSGTILVALCGVATFNVWYEGLILFKWFSLISTPNSWAFVLITPLFYLYYRLQLTGSKPGQRQWLAHLFVPGVLLVAYIGMALVSPVPDKFIYAWWEFREGRHSWWGVFRISCYVLLAGQLSVYLPRLFGAGCGGNKPAWRLSRIRREMLLMLAFCVVALGYTLTTFYLFRTLYAISILLLTRHLFTASPLYRLSMSRLGRYLIPDPPPAQPAVKAPMFPMFPRFPIPPTLPKPPAPPAPPVKPTLYLSAEKEVLLEEVLRRNLHNSYFTLGQLARELCTNQTYVRYYFARQRSTTFSKYLCSLRIDKSERLLLETNLQIVDIVEQVGFQGLSGFYAAFTARHKLPPAQWRKQAIADASARTSPPTPGGA